MPEYRLQFKSRISRRAAHEMILLFAMHGNHYHETHFKSDADGKRAFVRNGVDFEKLVMQCRDYQQAVPFFENMIGSTASPVGGATIARIDNRTGETDLNIQSPGALIMYRHWAAFEAAIEARNRAIGKASYVELQSAIVQGIASIEGYINYRVELWNEQHKDSPLLDSHRDKVSFEDKIDIWIPTMTGSRKLNKSGADWRDFRILRAIRDDEAIHPKTSGYSFSYSELAQKINLFRTGIARLLIQLHLLFDEKIPRVIIRAAYYYFVNSALAETIRAG